jgi:hypothetical protein
MPIAIHLLCSGAHYTIYIFAHKSRRSELSGTRARVLLLLLSLLLLLLEVAAVAAVEEALIISKVARGYICTCGIEFRGQSYQYVCFHSLDYISLLYNTVQRVEVLRSHICSSVPLPRARGEFDSVQGRWW